MQQKNGLCAETLCAIFLPRAREETKRHYCDFLTVTPQVAPYCVKLVNLNHSPGGGSKFIADFDIYPYIGSHITIAVCRMTVSVSGFDGEVCTVAFRQLRSFPVPCELWDVLRQPF